MILHGCCCMRMDGVSQMTSHEPHKIHLIRRHAATTRLVVGIAIVMEGQSQLKSAIYSRPPHLGLKIKMAWKSVFNGAARSFFTPRQPSVSSILRTRMNHSTGGFEPLFPPIRSSGNVPPHMGFGLLKEAVVAAFRSLTVVSVGLLVADLIHGTEASHLREKVGKDLAELRTRIEVTELALEAMRTATESVKTSRDLLIKSFLQQKELMQEFQAEQEKAMQDLKRRRD